MNTIKLKLARPLLCVSAILISGCATQPEANDKQTAEPTQGQFITGSRLSVKNTTEMIGVKTIAGDDVRHDKMFMPILGKDGK